jgi:hypothetical protein
MGWNKGYTIFEATVIGAYDLDKLDTGLLAVLMKPYADSDIDSGGRRGLLSKDGKSVEQVVVELMGGGPTPPYPQDSDGDEVWDDYHDVVTGQFYLIVQKHFGWC